MDREAVRLANEPVSYQIQSASGARSRLIYWIILIVERTFSGGLEPTKPAVNRASTRIIRLDSDNMNNGSRFKSIIRGGVAGRLASEADLEV